MDSANRDSKFVADSVSKGTRLCKRDVVRIRRHSATHKAGLSSHELPVLFIAQANRFFQNCMPASSLLGDCRSFLGSLCSKLAGRQRLMTRESVKLFNSHALADRRKS